LEKQKFYDRSLVEMIVDDMEPFMIVEKSGFKSFVASLRPGYALPSRGKMTSSFEEYFNEEISKLQKFCQNQKYVSYTADMWKSRGLDYYLSISLHFITDDWELTHVLVSTSHVIGTHQKDSIEKNIAEKIKPFLGPNSKIHSGVTDGEKSSQFLTHQKHFQTFKNT